MTQFINYVALLSPLIFCAADQAMAHPVDIHLPTSYDYILENEYERSRANEKAEEVLNNPESYSDEIDKALEQLYGPNGNRA